MPSSSSDVLFCYGSGKSAVSPSRQYLAFTNLCDGVEILTLPGLVHLGTIQQNIPTVGNIVLGIQFLDDQHIIVGDQGGIRVYELLTLNLAAKLMGPSSTGTS